MNRLALRDVLRLLGLRPGEERLTGTFMAYAFLVGLASSFVQVTSYALFLSSFAADSLPWVYIGIAITLTIGSSLYAWIQTRVVFGRFLWGAVAFNVVSLTAIWIALRLTGNRWLHMALPVWHEMVVFINLVVYWEYCGRLFDIRQGKRLFGAIRSFEFLAGIVGGLGAAVLAAPLGTENLLGFACGINLLVLLLGLRIQRQWSKQLRADVAAEADAATTSTVSWRSLMSNRFAVLIFAMVGITILEYYVLDNVFYGIASQRYADDASFARFYGVFSAAAGLLTWVTLGLLSGPVMSRFGLSVSLQVMPVAILGCVTLAIAGDMFDGPVAIVFWLVVASKLLDDVLTPAFNEGSINVLYQVLSASERTRVRSIADGIVYPVTAGIAGVLLLLLNGPLRLDYRGLLPCLLIIVTAGVLIACLLPREYRLALKRALLNRRLGSVSDILRESSGLDAIRAGLHDTSASRVVYCLEMLTQINDKSLTPALLSLLDHPDPVVRREALRRMERLDERQHLAGPVRTLLETETDVTVRGQALRTMGHLIETGQVEVIAPYLTSAEVELRRGALVGLIRGSGIAGTLAAGQELLRAEQSDSTLERVLAAEVIGEIGIRQFYQPLVALLQDRSKEVRRAALVASRRVASRRLVQPVMNCISIAQLRSEVIAALIAIGEESIDTVSEQLLRAQEQDDLTVAARLVYVLGRIESPLAPDRLLKLMPSCRPRLRRAVAEALSQQEYRADDESLETIRRWTTEEASLIAWNLTVASDLRESAECDLLVRGLYQDVDRRRDSLVYFLALQYPGKSILRTRSQMTHRSAEKRALAVEMLDNVLSVRDKQMLLPMIDTNDRSGQAARLRGLFELESMSQSDRLTELLTSSRTHDIVWLRCAALHAVGLTRTESARDAAFALVDSAQRHVKAMAEWAIGQLDKAHGVSANRMSGDQTPGPASCIMLTPVERVIFLKGVSIFSQLPDADLLELSDRLREEEFGPEMPVIVEGDLGSSLYVLVSGEVRVHSGEQQYSTLGEGAVFGELAALDPEPRSASVTSTQDSLLFSLDEETLNDLMNEHPAVARNIIHVLCDRVRESSARSRE